MSSNYFLSDGPFHVKLLVFVCFLESDSDFSRGR